MKKKKPNTFRNNLQCQIFNVMYSLSVKKKKKNPVHVHVHKRLVPFTTPDRKLLNVCKHYHYSICQMFPAQLPFPESKKRQKRRKRKMKLMNPSRQNRGVPPGLKWPTRTPRTTPVPFSCQCLQQQELSSHFFFVYANSDDQMSFLVKHFQII